LILKGGQVKLLSSEDSREKRPAASLHPAYASPEEIRGGKPDVRAALYSLGCTLYELIAGAPPYHGQEGEEILRAHVDSPIPDLREASIGASSKGVSSEMATIVRELLEKNPESRMQTPGELIARLKQEADRLRPRGGTPEASLGSDVRPAADRPRGSRAAKTASPAPAPPGKSPQRKTKIGGRERRRRSLPKREAETAKDFAPPRKSIALTLAGGVLGTLFGVLLLILQLKNMKHASNRAYTETVLLTAKEQDEYLVNRKAAAIAKNAADQKAIVEFLAANRKHDPALRSDALIAALDGHFNNSAYRRVLVDELVKIWTTTRSEALAESESTRSQQTFKEQKLAAEKLHDEGMIGKAIAKIMENHHELKALHETEIDERVERWSAELTEKWEATKAQVDQMLPDGKSAAVGELLLEAIEYGDKAIAREAEALLRHAHSVAARRQGTKNQLRDDVARLEEEFAEDEDEDEDED
jgi:hypothetical protein